MQTTRLIIAGSSLAICAFFISCSKSATSTAAGDPKAVVASISTAIEVAGTGMATGSRTLSTRPTAANCDEHGYPNGISQSDPNYPGHLSYCFMTVDSGDTIRGGFGTPTDISCLLTALGVTYDGVAHATPITAAATTACGLDPSDLPDGTSVTITASSPASFNSNYTHGAIVDLSSSLGLTFKIAFNTSGSTQSFITSESWSDGSIGTAGGTFNSSTGDLWYESRTERENCTVSSRCGWNRHNRIHALLTVNSAGEPTGLTNLSFGYSNIQFTPGQSSLGGTLITAQGALSTGIKARLWSATNGSSGSPAAASDYDTVGNWVETTNTKCYTHSSEDAGTCDAGLDKFTTNTKFLLHSTDSHLAVADWLTTITGQAFTSTVIDSDTQF